MGWTPTNKHIQKYLASDDSQSSSFHGAYLRRLGNTPFTIAEKLGVPKKNIVKPWFLETPESDVTQHPYAQDLADLSLPLGGLAKVIGLGGKIAGGLSRASKIVQQAKYADQLKSAEQADQEAGEAHTSAKSEAEANPNIRSSKPNKLAADIAEGREWQLGRSAVEPQMPEEPEEKVTPLKQEPMTNLEIEEENPDALANAKSKSRLAGWTKEKHGEEIGHFLKAGDPHGVAYQDAIVAAHEKNRGEISEGYDESEAKLAKDNVKITHSGDSKALNKELLDLAAQSFNVDKGEANSRVGRVKSSPQMEEVAKQLQMIGKTEEINAADYARTARSVKKLGDEEYNKARVTNSSITEDQRKVFEQRGDEYYDAAEKMEKHLEKSLGDKYPEHKETRAELNSRWRSEVRSLDKNTFYNELRKKAGISHTNIFTKLEGSAEGQKHLRNLTTKDPKILRSALAHAYADKPELMLKTYDKHIESFINKDKGLSNMRNDYRAAHQAEQTALTEEFEAKEKDSARKERNKAAKQKQTDINAKNTIARQKYTAEKAREKAKSDVRKENEARKKATATHAKMDQAIDEKEAALEKIKTTMKDKTRTAAQHAQSQLEHDRIIKDISHIKRLGGKLGKYGAGAAILATSGYGLYTLIANALKGD